jgi:hypothetical protein
MHMFFESQDDQLTDDFMRLALRPVPACNSAAQPRENSRVSVSALTIPVIAQLPSQSPTPYALTSASSETGDAGTVQMHNRIPSGRIPRTTMLEGPTCEEDTNTLPTSMPQALRIPSLPHHPYAYIQGMFCKPGSISTPQPSVANRRDWNSICHDLGER